MADGGLKKYPGGNVEVWLKQGFFFFLGVGLSESLTGMYPAGGAGARPADGGAHPSIPSSRHGMWIRSTGKFNSGGAHFRDSVLFCRKVQVPKYYIPYDN